MALSARPTLLVDGGIVGTPTTQVGVAGPLGRARVVMTLPFKDGPRLLQPAEVLAGIADPSGSRVGWPPIWVHRLVVATKAEDTRRL
jgi:hypothetical protein